jgi:hypothetical protein
MINLKGQELFSKNFGKTNPGETRQTINLAKIPDGAYTCVLTIGKFISECKLIVKH